MEWEGGGERGGGVWGDVGVCVLASGEKGEQEGTREGMRGCGEGEPSREGGNDDTLYAI